jgi:hypothetical protein
MTLTCELGQHISVVAKAADFIRTRTPDGFLDISFRRTIRVADNEGATYLPPDLGPFPIHPVAKFDRLPTAVKEKGGLFLPIHGEYYAACRESHRLRPF